MEGPKIFTINVIGSTDLDLERPMVSIGCRVSIVDIMTGQLIRKTSDSGQAGEKSSRAVVSAYESTDYIAPMTTKPVPIIDIAQLAPFWDESFRYNELVDSLITEHVVIFFEILGFDLQPHMDHFTPLCWAFLRPRAADGKPNVDFMCRLQLHSYPKDFNPQIIGANVPVSQLLAGRNKIPGYLTIEIKYNEPEDQYDVTGRPKHFFHREVGNEDINKLIQRDTTTTEGETAGTEESKRKFVKKIRPTNRNCTIPRALAGLVPIGEHGAHALTFNRNGDLLAAAVQIGSAYSIQLFSVYDFTKPPITIKNAHLGLIYELQFDTSDTHLLSASADGSVKVWYGSGSTFTLKYTLQHTEYVYTAKFYPDEPRCIATGCHDGKVRIWDAPKKNVVAILEGNKGTVNSITFSPDGKTLYSGDSSGQICVFNTDIRGGSRHDIVRKLIAKDEEIKDVPITHLSMELSPYSLLVHTRDNVIRIFETKVMVPSQRYTGTICTKFNIPSVFSPDCQFVLAGSEDGTAKVWAARKADIIETPEWNFKFDYPVTAVAWNPVENMVAFSSFGPKQPIIIFKDPTPLPEQGEDDDLDQF
ncbi:hypothetical protein TVAG_132900 [Trichomonas vaginalis G3]|uniref:Uncharacterized protein n=1 Tax=Trichomonas vaginalis (strain ATCC PRA-98 / G3) TaxID=412133 RepID=A2G3I2_TRIV3|nr:jouberin family [Trichomonas vaginalis G3]EAX88285.1 hypothetical protein TVAG_132900 [Trichomonas vaginalis G3]KAI5488700.1 jouberin family [Trichomonas vaginalis G3]|eukprot:XP_001301215.1 hypothetical protein [Trichomonas vaginalis G3]